MLSRAARSVLRRVWLLTPARAARPASRRTADRYLDRTARVKGEMFRHIDYMSRFDQKYTELSGALDKYDGNPFT